MAITTVRDLAFKVSVVTDIKGIKEINTQIDKLKSTILNLKQDIEKGFAKINVNPAVNKINEIKKKALEARQAINGLGEQPNPTPNIPSNPPKPTGNPKPTGSPTPRAKGINLPYQSKLNVYTSRFESLKNIILPGIYSSMGKINMTMAKMSGSQQKINIATEKNRELLRKMTDIRKNLINTMGRENYTLLGGIGGLQKMLGIAGAIGLAMKGWQYGKEQYKKALDVYADYTDGYMRMSTFFANTLRYQDEQAGKQLKHFSVYKEMAQDSVEEAKKNIRAVAQEGVVSAKELTTMVGQLASFQIDTKAWFGGEQGKRNIEVIADLMASIQLKGGNKGEALRTGNMLGKALTMGQFGQLQRWGIVLTDTQKNMIKTGTIAQRQSALINGLMQNVGDFNKEMAETNWGKSMKYTNQANELYYSLGEKFVFLKLQLQELGNNFLEFVSPALHVGASILGLLIKSVNIFFKMWKWVSEPIVNMNGELTTTERILNGIKGVLYILQTVLLSLPLIIEDFWVFLNGGDSIIGRLVNKIKNSASDMWEHIKSKGLETKDKIVNWFLSIKDEIANGIKEAFNSMLNSIEEKMNQIVSWLPNKFYELKSKLPTWMGGENYNTSVNPISNATIATQKSNDGISTNDTQNQIKNVNANNTTNKVVNIAEGAIVQNISGASGEITHEEMKNITANTLNEMFDKIIYAQEVGMA